MLSKIKRDGMVMLFCIVSIVSIAFASEIHSASKTYSSGSQANVYGYVSVTENSFVRPASYTSYKSGSNQGALPCYLYVWTGKNVDKVKADNTYMQDGKHYSATFNTTNKYIGMKVHSTQSGGTYYINIYASYS